MAERNLSANLTEQLSQHQILSHNLRRSLEMLALPLPELESRLIDELAANPLLEVEDTPIGQPNESVVEKAPETEDENDFENYDTLADQWYENLPLPAADDEKSDYIGSFAAPPPELRSELIMELQSIQLPEKLLQHALLIVSNLDENGFLAANTADLAMQCDAELDEIEKALHLVQQISPPGIGARDLPECLKLQLQRKGELTPLLKKVLDQGWTYLLNNRLDMLQKKFDLSEKQLKDILQSLRTLNLAPGREYAAPSGVIIPDLRIVRGKDGSYTAIPCRNSSQNIGISKVYEKMFDDPSLSDDEKTFFNEKLASAKELLKALEMRESTLQKLGDAIIRNQKDFLDNGTAALKPWTMKSAAAEINVSESTVSRAAADKYAETPQGIIPLKFFFSSGIVSDDGGVSNQAVMEKIRELIDREDPAAPLSDETLAKELKAIGIPIARRTVAKYREHLKIPASSMRKKFF